MKKASVSQAKNQLSKLLEDVKRGETILVQDRGKPVARIVPYLDSDLPDLVRDGIVSPPTAALDVEAFLSSPRPKLPAGISASQAVIEEREEGM